jgi:hypothetical protein
VKVKQVSHRSGSGHALVSLTLKITDTSTLALRLSVTADNQIRGIWAALSDLSRLDIFHPDRVGTPRHQQSQHR